MNRRPREASFRGKRTGSRKTRNVIEPKWTRKNIVIDQRKLDLAKTLLHAPTETATVDQAGYCAAVERAKEYIAAGDVIQVVLSQRLAAEIHSRPFDLYRALRSLNPSPYMYFLQFEDCQIIGSSPEILVTERRGEVVTRPLAGTRSTVPDTSKLFGSRPLRAASSATVIPARAAIADSVSPCWTT